MPNPPYASGLEEDFHRYALVVSYDGSAFKGWQVQTGRPSVEGALSQALALLAGGPVKVYGSGRTDAGVHAYNQVAHFDLPKPLEPYRLARSLNGLCKPHITVKAVLPVNPQFHARHSALGKTYRYQLHNRPYPPVFDPQRLWWVGQPLNLADMSRAGQALLGTHDFSAFRARDCSAATPVRTLRRVEVIAPANPDGCLAIELEGTGFLQHMARILVGTLVTVGLGKLAPEQVAQLLAGRNRAHTPATAPAQGLHLARVYYSLERFPELKALEPLYRWPWLSPGQEPWPLKKLPIDGQAPGAVV